MHFLVILISLTINYVWLKDLDRFNDSWFFKFTAQVERLTAESAQSLSFGWFIPVLLIYGVPIFAVGLVLLLLQDVLFGTLVMLVHILVLLVVFDRTQPGKLAKDFLALWVSGDTSRCHQFLQEEMASGTDDDIPGEPEALAAYFGKQLTYRCFEKMFVVFFWYMVTGPLGVVFCYVTYQLRDDHSRAMPAIAQHYNRVLLRVLEWLPMRLLVLSFSLAGNFVKCFAKFKQVLWDFSLDTDHADLLYDFAGAALDGSEPSAEEDFAQDASLQSRIAQRIEALQALLERTQLIWLSVLALITVFGINV